MPDLASKCVGVFDSGVGGLTVLAALRRALPQESLLYLGDTARIPYGSKPLNVVRGFAVQICTEYLHTAARIDGPGGGAEHLTLGKPLTASHR